jgi:hypothetical protein
LLQEKAKPAELATRTGRTRNNIDAINHQCKKLVIEEGNKLLNAWKKLEENP